MIARYFSFMRNRKSTWADLLWGQFSRPIYLGIASFLLLFLMLGVRELWTQEHRWADIVSGMFFRQDFFHPYLDTHNYYDKPLLSYWIIAALTAITQQLNTTVLRLPSAFAGLLAIGSIYRLGTRLKNKSFGLLCGWLMLTTFYFIFWARISSADMLNLAGSLFAVCWYFEKRDQPSSINFGIFFIILALTSLCKGLGGAVVAMLAVLPDLLYQHRWKQYMRVSLFMSLLPALIIYILPFWLSAHINSEHYSQNGLYLVYRENFLRYFHPFDHKDPIYIYFIFLPIYLLPWTIFFIPALWNLRSRWRTLDWNSRWMGWALLILFVFFTLSGSRRNYYILPLVPFAILLSADWLVFWAQKNPKNMPLAGRLVIGFFLLFVLFFNVLQPLYYSQGSYQDFSKIIQQEATKLRPWKEWQFILLDPESKIAFYLHLSPHVKYLGIEGDRDQQNAASLLRAWPVLREPPERTILISRKHYKTSLSRLLPQYRMIDTSPTLRERWLHHEDPNAAIALIPKK